MTAERTRSSADIIAGIILVVGGVAMAAYSATATRVSVVVLAWVVIAIGAGTGFRSYLKRREKRWWIHLIGGVLLVILGIFFLTNPAATQLTLAVVAGLYFILSGVLRLFASYRTDKYRTVLSAGGVLSVVLGALLLSRIGDSSWDFALGLLIGIELVIEGVTLALAGSDPANRASARGLASRIKKSPEA
ncbi:MAG TPA: DUF308 domain-containing protein [Actinomycetaceae bacterium]|nr:DUF308 domain-containing protein [Actinomycetaceae bacterium]